MTKRKAAAGAAPTGAEAGAARTIIRGGGAGGRIR